MKVLIVFGTTDGMTARIADRLASTARAAGHAVEVREASAAPPPAAFDAVLVGASLHAGGYQRPVTRYVTRHREALNGRPSAFFSVCLAIASPCPQERKEARRVAAAFPARLGWRPAAVEVIAGALMFSRYGFLRKLAMTRIARRELSGDIDTTRDHIYTDWNAVDRFALAFLGARAVAEAAAAAAP